MGNHRWLLKNHKILHDSAVLTGIIFKYDLESRPFTNYNMTPYDLGMSIEKMWRNDEILKYYVICAAVSALSWLSQFCTSKKKCQIAFLMRNQGH